MRLGDRPTIVGQECARCGRRAFPPDPYGCERCGADVASLQPIDLPATGTVHAVATVHRHHHPSPETPFTVATIVLDDGITLKGVLATDADTDTGTETVAVGRRVEGTTVPFDVDEDGTEVVDLRFRLLPVAGGDATSGGA